MRNLVYLLKMMNSMERYSKDKVRYIVWELCKGNGLI